VRENAFDELRLLDARDHLQAPAAACALLDLEDRSLLPEYSRDGVHLTESGYDVWAGELRPVLATKGGDL
jgi:lysophospholipase L1-like esterase